MARAVTVTLRDYPWINGEIRGDKIITRNFVNLGFAVELADGKGLIVLVVKHAEGLNLLGMPRRHLERARNKQLSPDEVQGGTFMITNPGGYGTFHERRSASHRPRSSAPMPSSSGRRSSRTSSART